ncbi:MAG: hypothetical protein ACXAEN_26920 [Candidatus Thorarchaeota archaeon]|jgi:hypothetical protein
MSENKKFETTYDKTESWSLKAQPMTVIDIINRRWAATGSMRTAMLTESADYNGHHVRVHWNNYRRYWITEYYWAGRRVMYRGRDFKRAVQVAKEEYDRGAKGATVSVSLNGPEDGMTRHEQRDFLASLGFEEFRSTGWANDKPEWWTDLHEEVSSAMTLEQHLGIPATGFLANSTSVEEYKAKLDGFKRERMAR